MRLLQNLLITDNARFLFFIFELEDFSHSIRMGLSLAKQLMSLEKMFVINKVHYFDFLVSCLYTFNPLSLSLKWVMTVVATTYRNMENGQSCKIINMIWVKGSERRPFIFIFRLKEYCSARFISGTIHIRQMKLSWKLKNGNKKFQVTMSKALVEFY